MVPDMWAAPVSTTAPPDAAVVPTSAEQERLERLRIEAIRLRGKFERIVDRLDELLEMVV